MINIQLALRTGPDLRKNVSLSVLLGNNCNSYTNYAARCVFIHIHSQHKEAGRAEEIKNLGQQ
jgi:hypothetical protein